MEIREIKKWRVGVSADALAARKNRGLTVNRGWVCASAIAYLWTQGKPGSWAALVQAGSGSPERERERMTDFYKIAYT